MKIKLVLIVLNLPPLLFVLSPDSKMVKNIKIGWKLTKLWKIFLGAFKNKIDTNYGSEIWNYGSKNYGKEIPFLPYPFLDQKIGAVVSDKTSVHFFIFFLIIFSLFCWNRSLKFFYLFFRQKCAWQPYYNIFESIHFIYQFSLLSF